MWGNNYFLQRGSTANWSTMKTSTLACLEAMTTEQWALSRVVTLRHKDLIGSLVWKYSGALWQNSLCKSWWEPLVMTQRSQQACQFHLQAAQISTQLWRTSTAALTRTLTLAETNFNHSSYYVRYWVAHNLEMKPRYVEEQQCFSRKKNSWTWGCREDALSVLHQNV